jgi:hypothetical protein
VRARVEAGGFEVAAYLGKRRARFVGDVYCASINRPIDVEHPEPDAFHVESTNRHGERRAFGEERRRGIGPWLPLHAGNEDLQTLFRGFPVIDACRHIQNGFQPPAARQPRRTALKRNWISALPQQPVSVV